MAMYRIHSHRMYIMHGITAGSALTESSATKVLSPVGVGEGSEGAHEHFVRGICPRGQDGLAEVCLGSVLVGHGPATRALGAESA